MLGSEQLRMQFDDLNIANHVGIIYIKGLEVGESYTTHRVG